MKLQGNGTGFLWDRRTFLKAGAAAGALSKIGNSTRPLSRLHLPPVPTVHDLAGVRIVHNFRDLFSLPTTHNELGYVQAAKSVSGITALALPPYACCGIPETPWSPGFLLTCELFLNGRILISYPAGDSVAYTWYPHRIVREAELDGLNFLSETFMPARKRVVAQRIKVKNLSGQSRRITLGFNMRAAVAKKTTPWITNSPGEADNLVEWDGSRGCLIFRARHSAAICAQGILPKADRVDSDQMLIFEVELNSGETREFHYACVVDGNLEGVVSLYDKLQSSFEETAREHESSFNGLIRSAFTAKNSDFSGYLPQLETNDESLWELYQAGFKNLLFARRASPDSAYGTTYITLGGHVLPTLSFPWDTALTSLGLALLDPGPLRCLVETWLQNGMHEHMATDCVSGEAVGPWYGANDMSIVRCAENYLRVTGDFAWLDRRLDGKPIIEYLFEHALHWKKLDTLGHGLGDYGKIENLLEVVSTYVHETAGMNAGNVSSMRFVAMLLERRGDGLRAKMLRGEASELAQRINKKLYVAGKGWWRCGQPDGSFGEVRHCFDFLSVLDNMYEDLSGQQKKEMSDFFWNELHSELWMRALSPMDKDATWNIRPDHSWLGAYSAWPPMTAKGLYKIAASADVTSWVRNLAKAGNQGPIGQAHFVESVFPPEHGAAYKCPNDPPYINDWCCIAGGGFLDLVINTIFGADLTLFDGIQLHSRVAAFDPKARLSNVRYQGKNFRISAGRAEQMLS